MPGRLKEPTDRLVARVAGYCVPQAVAHASLLLAMNGRVQEVLSPKDVARTLLRRQPRSRGWLQVTTLHRFFGNPVSTNIYVPRSKRITLARWLREDGRNAIVCAGYHAHVVWDGEVVFDNGTTKRRGRVSDVILLTP